MKALIRNISIMAATLFIATVPVLAVEGTMGHEQPQVHKSECLLLAKNCPTDSIQERITRIQSEIDKGSAVYTADELRRLNRELKEAQRILDSEITGG